jgi:Tol biopolymer transport system component
MMLAPGTRLGSYDVSSVLGAGSMGEVYRAHDARLGRDVAVKILPAAFSKDADRLKRFQQEARAAGTLNHPNIVAIFDVGAHEGSPYLVSELLEGQTLRHCIGGRPMSVRKALEYARHIASGLAAAHEKGIVHRDLKPDNVFVTRDGHVKILDFGLAKLVDSGVPEDEKTGIAQNTQAGMLIGTPKYMSPEQARGLPADYRSDVFSLGAILYEMLAGRAPFQGTTATDTLSAILRDDPDEFPAASPVPPAVDRVVRHCLEKEPQRRFQSARDLAFALESLAAPQAPAAAVRRPVMPRLALAGAVLLAAGAAVVFALRWRPATQKPRETHVNRLTDLPGVEEFAAISPDGRSVAFTADVDGRRQVFIRLVAGGAPLQVTRNPADHLYPRWSPDSSAIVYFTPPSPDQTLGTIWEMPALGGQPRRITASLGGADVSVTDGRLAFFRLAGGNIELVTASAKSSVINVVAQFPPVTYYLYPRWSPDGTSIAFQRGDSIRFDLFVVRTTGGEPRQVTQDNNMIAGFAWLPDSSAIVYSGSRGTTMPYLPTLNLWQVRLADRVVQQLTSGETSYMYPDITPGGTLVASRLRMQSDIWRFPVDGEPSQNTQRGVRLTHQTGQVLTPTAGPSDKEVAFLSDSGGHANLWTIDTASGELRQITDERDASVAMGVPVWSPDGRAIAFVSSRGNPGLTFGIWLVNPDGSQLRQVANPGLGPAWSSDGRWLYYSTRGAQSTGAVMKKMPAEGGPPETVRTDPLRNVIGSDGSAVYYIFERSLVDGTPEFEIRAARPENAPFRVLTRIPASRVPIWQIVNPSLSPDGHLLAQALTDGFTTNVWAASTATGEWRQLTDFGRRATFIARRVSWSSDGRFVLAAIAEGDADIVLMEGLPMVGRP